MNVITLCAYISILLCVCISGTTGLCACPVGYGNTDCSAVCAAGRGGNIITYYHVLFYTSLLLLPI